MKHSARAFLAAFFCALAAAGLVFGFVVADRNTRLTGLRENEPFLTVQRTSSLTYRVNLLGEQAELSLAPLNTAAAYTQQLFCFAPPGTRLLMRLSSTLSYRFT